MPLAAAIAVAMPEELVTALDEANVALGPDAGAVKFTPNPARGLPFESVTLAESGLPKFTPAAVLCGVPETAVMVAGAVVVLVRVNVAVRNESKMVRTETVPVYVPAMPLAVS